MHFGHPVDLSLTDNEDVIDDSSDFCSNDMLNGGGKVFWSTWYRQASNAGIYGDPTTASAETGKKTFDAIIEQMVAFGKEFHSFKPKTS